MGGWIGSLGKADSRRDRSAKRILPHAGLSFQPPGHTTNLGLKGYGASVFRSSPRRATIPKTACRELHSASAAVFDFGSLVVLLSAFAFALLTADLAGGLCIGSVT